MRRAPIRVRLTAWYVLALAAVLVALGAFVVIRLRSDLVSEIDRSLSSAAAQISRGYTVEGPVEFRDVARTVLPGPRDRGSGAQILDPAGRVVLRVGDQATSRPLVNRSAAGVVLKGSTFRDSLRAGSPEEHLRIVAVPTRRGGRRQVLVVAEPLRDVDASVHTVRLLLLIGGLTSLGLLALGGWWIARQALRPVEQMTTRADQIGIDDLSQRIAEPRVQDEVGHLAGTLNAMLDRLEAGVETRERLVADASHELRAPLAAMRSELEVSLRQDALPDRFREVLASARDEVVRIGRVVDNLLMLARLDAGRLELLVAPENLREVADRSARAHRAAAAAGDVEVSVRGDGVVVQADAERIGQVLNNLIDNAIRFAPPAGEVAVSVWRNGSEAGVTVSDDGPGVPPEARERVFERFSREDPARGRTGGAGLGLAIAQEIVRSHAGRIYVTEREGGGCAFVVSLPTTPQR